MLSSQQVDFYAQNGYLMVENALSVEQLTLLRQVTQRFIDDSRELTESNEVFGLDEGHSAESPKLTRLKLPHLRHEAYADVLRSERIVSVLQSLLGPDVRLNTSKLNTKAPGGGAPVEWHQDWAFYPHTNDDLLAIGIMLDDVDADNGPLLVIPGSHRGPVLNHSVNGVFSGAIDVNDPDFDVSKAIALTGKAGSMSIHHVRTLHGSAPNLSTRPRQMLFYECIAADAWPITGIVSNYMSMDQQAYWDMLCERMICGTQSIYPRMAEVPVTMPLPPAADSSSIFNIQKGSGVTSAFEPQGNTSGAVSATASSS